MIPEFVAAFEKNKDRLREMIDENPPEDYIDLVRMVAKILEETDSPGIGLDADEIAFVRSGRDEGELCFLITGNSYEETFYTTQVSYGSCTACDALDACRNTDDYVTLALHIVQKLKQV